MASAYWRAGKLYMRYKDERGRWKDKVCDARTKTEAKRLADDLERKCERQRLGLEPMPLENGGGTIAELLIGWLDVFARNPLASSQQVDARFSLLERGLRHRPQTAQAGRHCAR